MVLYQPWQGFRFPLAQALARSFLSIRGLSIGDGDARPGPIWRGAMPLPLSTCFGISPALCAERNKFSMATLFRVISKTVGERLCRELRFVLPSVSRSHQPLKPKAASRAQSWAALLAQLWATVRLARSPVALSVAVRPIRPTKKLINKRRVPRGDVRSATMPSGANRQGDLR